ncbi:hypothetical protein HJC23_000731 [Cyclotella cryptica]|uniref:Uncharacterized protein n=1 Tax=Cyclotella cryptica TaxID=29204 RepID=A0ABD3QA70_9STRA|eukprot:CCRYP_007421-RA/>CCRYP_007421-RA protein AED:0.49 eAED:0.29 QI:0/-1/0/1/-1/1/1/0/835
MSDPSSAFLAAAFAAGIIEGSSVLRHYRNVLHKDAASSISTPCLAAHVVLYGAASLPLGMVGASPGVAFYPRSLKAWMASQETTDDHHEPSSEKHDEPIKAPEAGISRNSELQEIFITSARSSPVVGTGRGIARMLREENSKKITHSSSHSNQHHREAGEPSVLGAVAAERNVAPIPPRSEAFLLSQNSQLSRYVSTLDGRSLPTPLSEAMRRSRCLFIGAALFSLAVTQHLSNDYQNKTFRANDCIDYGSIIDENGRIDHSHDSKLRRRLRADIVSEAVTHRDSINNKAFPVDLLQYRVYSISENAQKVVLSGLYNAIESLELQFGKSLDFPPFNWLFKWKNAISASQDEEGDCRPIAIRLIMNDVKTPPSFSPLLSRFGMCGSPFPWLSSAKKEENDCSGYQKHNSFFVLPLFVFGYQGLSHHINKLSYPWWMVDFKPKPFHELPINSSWLLSDRQQQGVNENHSTAEGAQSKFSTHSEITSSSRLLIVEANTCLSIHDVLRRRYAEKKSKLNVSDGLISTGHVVAFARMLVNLARIKCLDSAKNVTTSTILIHGEDKVALKDNDLQTWNKFVCIDALDLLKWALLASINNICENHEKANKVVLGDVSSGNASQANGAASERISDVSDRDVATLWTIVDVLGTSIRHLFQSTYRIASTITFLGRLSSGNNMEDNTQKTTMPKVMHVVSSCGLVSSWLEESLNNRDWKVQTVQPESFPRNEFHCGGILFIFGKTDIDTCELASSIIENPAIWRDPNTKLLILLEDPSMYEMISASMNQVEYSHNSANATIIGDKVTVLCTSCLYELAFAVTRSYLCRKASLIDIELELERRFSQ